MIPIYRAKKIDSNEYVEGYVTHCPSLQGIKEETIMNVVHFDSQMGYEFLDYVVDPSTLSIHFPDMLDSDGNKIFASLSEDGKGGDNLEVEYSIRGTHDRRVRDGISIFKSYSYAIQCKIDGELIVFDPNYFIITKVTGIQQ